MRSANCAIRRVPDTQWQIPLSCALRLQFRPIGVRRFRVLPSRFLLRQESRLCVANLLPCPEILKSPTSRERKRPRPLLTNPEAASSNGVPESDRQPLSIPAPSSRKAPGWGAGSRVRWSATGSIRSLPGGRKYGSRPQYRVTRLNRAGITICPFVLTMACFASMAYILAEVRPYCKVRYNK